MTTNAIESQGTVLKLGDGASPEVFTAISELKTITGPSGSAIVIDVTTLENTARAKKMGVPDSGQMALTANHLPANTQHAALFAAWQARTLLNFQLIFTDAGNTQWDFSAYVIGFASNNAVDGVSEANITLEIDEDITEV